MIVKIKRQLKPGDTPYWQTFRYEGDRNKTVAALLDDLNYSDNLYDIDGKSAPRIRWECSCLQKMCGACAMVINKTPALACDFFLNTIKGDTLTLEPLSKFPVISDLIVDRSQIDETLKKAGIYADECRHVDKKEYPHQYAVAKCLKCGLCLEVCPNYISGANFYGALFANDAYLTKSISAGRTSAIQKEYQKHFAAGCSKSLACVGICPMKLPTLSSILKMNR